MVAARHSDPYYGLLQLDFQNAFNLINHEAFLGEVCKYLPALAPWVVWCYEDPACLLFHGHVKPSGQGVQQGDPLRPLLSSLALQVIISQFKQALNGAEVSLHCSYLDDGVIIAHRNALQCRSTLLVGRTGLSH
jgi:Reverse transcriptase (RNA-dependent DNA polymerase)